MKQVFQSLIVTITAMLLIIISANVYFVIFVNNGLHYDPIKIEEGLVLNPGDSFSPSISRCADKTYEVDVRSSLVRKVDSGNELGHANEEILITSIHTTADKGCKSFTGVERTLPLTTPPGEYVLRNILTYKISWLLFSKERDIIFESNPFIVRTVKISDEAYIK